MTGSPERSLDNVTPADMYWGRYEQSLAERQKIKSHRRPGAIDGSTPKKPPAAAVIFIRNYKAPKSISSLFTAPAARPYLSTFS
jgi:hypothetical protein